MTPPLLALVGPTASGKTEASIRLAAILDAEIVSVDSTLVYRGIDVGTSKPSPADRRAVPHHLLDLVEPGEAFSVWEFQRLAADAVAGIRRRGRVPLLVSGGGLYYRALVDGLEFPPTDERVRGVLEAEAAALGPNALYARLVEADPAAAARIEPTNVRRTIRALEVAAVTGRPFSTFAERWDEYPPDAVRAAGIAMSREALHRRIEQRARAQMPGLLDETRALRGRGLDAFLETTRAIGYPEAAAVLEGRMGEEEAIELTIRRTKALARRQLAWLRRDPRIRWFDARDRGAAAVVEDVLRYLRDTSRHAVGAAPALGPAGG